MYTRTTCWRFFIAENLSVHEVSPTSDNLSHQKSEHACISHLKKRLFVHSGKYKNNLLEIFHLRNGGLAIYGAVIGGFLTLYVFSRMKKQSFFQMADAGVFGLLVGQAENRNAFRHVG